MSDRIWRIVGTVLFVWILVYFWKPILKFAVVVTLIGIVFLIVTVGKASHIEDEIRKDPDAYFEKQKEDAEKRGRA